MEMITHYICAICKYQYESPEEALKCEASVAAYDHIPVGAQVKYKEYTGIVLGKNYVHSYSLSPGHTTQYKVGFWDRGERPIVLLVSGINLTLIP